jgi:hypothetical protein
MPRDSPAFDPPLSWRLLSAPTLRQRLTVMFAADEEGFPFFLKFQTKGYYSTTPIQPDLEALRSLVINKHTHTVKHTVFRTRE